eukprot:357528-Chlamydomonas_euryale.AAC.7
MRQGRLRGRRQLAPASRDVGRMPVAVAKRLMIGTAVGCGRRRACRRTWPGSTGRAAPHLGRAALHRCASQSLPAAARGRAVKGVEAQAVESRAAAAAAANRASAAWRGRSDCVLARTQRLMAPAGKSLEAKYAASTPTRERCADRQ